LRTRKRAAQEPINGVRVRLQGIDAPETEQFCLNDTGRPWMCKVSGQDIYSRSLARCYVGGEDIQKWLVHSGFALSYKYYSHDYDADEQAAREAHAGLWSGAFIAPWDWRHRNTSTEILGAVKCAYRRPENIAAARGGHSKCNNYRAKNQYGQWCHFSQSRGMRL
jgi:endonuclease YncB( thermonuclease family)